MTSDADSFNRMQLDNKTLTVGHVTALVEHWQTTHGLKVDGKAGSGETIPSINAALAPAGCPLFWVSLATNLLVGSPAEIIPAHYSWFGDKLAGGRPSAIVWHFTDTGPGTARSMARRRARPYGQPDDPKVPTSWHATVDTDGTIVQMVPFDHLANHAGGPGSLPIPGLGTANTHAVGIELVGFGDSFSVAQVMSACLVARALVQAYAIPRVYAMLQHSELNPTHRDDPGPVWMAKHAQRVVDFAFAP